MVPQFHTVLKGTASWVLPPFADRLPLVVCFGRGGSVALAARRGNVIADGQQCAPLFGKSRIRISEYRQDPEVVRKRGKRTAYRAAGEGAGVMRCPCNITVLCCVGPFGALYAGARGKVSEAADYCIKIMRLSSNILRYHRCAAHLSGGGG